MSGPRAAGASAEQLSAWEELAAAPKPPRPAWRRRSGSRGRLQAREGGKCVQQASLRHGPGASQALRPPALAAVRAFLGLRAPGLSASLPPWLGQQRWLEEQHESAAVCAGAPDALALPDRRIWRAPDAAFCREGAKRRHYPPPGATQRVKEWTRALAGRSEKIPPPAATSLP